VNLKKSLFVLVFLAGCATQKTVPTKKIIQKTPAPREKVVEVEAELTPTKTALKNIVMINHKYFKIAYDPEVRLARYVSYVMTASQLRQKNATREDKFIADPFLKEKNIPHVLPSEYVKSGYDRGHLAPSADFAFSKEANAVTFVMSNMAPQSPGLNRDAWRRLEDQVRKWACGEEKVTVITGPVISPSLPTLKSGLVIPQKFFKIVIDETPPVKIISFLYQQTDKGDVLQERMIKLNDLEKISGIAFNSEFPEMKNDKLRKPASAQEWKEADCN
jgi:endonuclease G, mitochondrial